MFERVQQPTQAEQENASEAVPTFSAAALQRLGEAIFESVGTPPDLAHVVAESLLSANLAGHDSHGIQRIVSYVSFVQSGRVAPAARAMVAERRQATATVDGHWGWGQPAARLATQTARDLAAEYGVGAVTIQRCHHIGRLGEYVESIAGAGMTGIVLCNAGPNVVPHGGRERRLGTNPFAWGAPTEDPERPFVLDYATSTVAAGKLDVALAKGQRVAPGLFVDADGRPSTSPADLIMGGALLPFGGHKGYALGVMAEVLGGVLSGGGASCLPDYSGGNGTLVIALNIAAFQPLARFVEQTERLSGALKSAKPAEGFDGVLVPGEPESRARRQRAEAGIPLPVRTWKEISDLAAQLGLRTVEMDQRGADR